MTIQIPTIETLIQTHEERHPAPVVTSRKCSQCGAEYHVRRQGVGGSCATKDDLANFPFEERSHTGVRAENAHWFHGAFCSNACYDAAYYEPPFPYGP